jgi:hypothetical protein
MLKNNRAGAPSGTLSSSAPNTLMARWSALWAGFVIALAALAAYHNSFSAPLLFDDRVAIAENTSIRHLAGAWSPPSEGTMAGRPALDLTFALNYLPGGTRVWSYHAVNLLIHALAGLTLFGSVRRTLLRPAFAGLSRRLCAQISGTGAKPAAQK